jgi:hypothetical protein
MRPINTDEYDRVVKLLVDADDTLTFPAARKLLRTYRLQVVVDADACGQAAWQAALLTAVNVGSRAVHGGVRVALGEDAVCCVPWARGRRLSEAVAELGGDVVAIGDTLEASVPTIVFGSGAVDAADSAPVVCALAGTWVAAVAPARDVRVDADAPTGSASVLAATLAATIAVSECFQWLRGHAVAGDRAVRVSLWDPLQGSDGPSIGGLPSELWLLGLGHLGQAYAWLLGLLPYPAVDAGSLVLQDDDRLSTANRATSMLHQSEAVGVRKTRLTAGVMERLGWETALVERRYGGGSLHTSADPQVMLGGVDNRDARRRLDETGFPLIYDAGLGAGPDGFLGMTVRRLPDLRPSSEIWPDTAPLVARPALSAAAYAALEAETGNRCGVELLAGRSVATAFVGVTAACWVLGGLLRELHGGLALSLVDFSLRDPHQVVALEAIGARPPRVATVPCSP